MGILRIKVADRIIEWVAYISLLLLRLIYIFKISVNSKIMKFYEAITDVYAHEIIARNDLSDSLCTLWPFVNVK
jgi:hypothetical protein